MVSSDQVFRQDMGEFLRCSRVKKNLSQREVSQLLGYKSPQFVSNIERGLAAPPFSSLKHLMRLYGLDKSEVIKIYCKHLKRILN